MSDSKIKVVIGTAYPFDETRVRGGVQAVALSLVKAISKYENIELHVISFSSDVKRSFEELRDGVHFHWLQRNSRLYGLRAISIDAWRAAKVYKQIRPDIIHAQAWSEYAVGAPVQIPLVLTIHGVEAFTPTILSFKVYSGVKGLYRRYVTKKLANLSIAKSSAIISIAGSYISRLMADRLIGKIVYHIPNPLENTWFTNMSGKEEEGSIFCVGNIREQKNTLGLVKAFSELVRNHPNLKTHLYLAGSITEPEYYRQVNELIHMSELDNRITYLGQLNQNDLLDRYLRSTIIALASVQETSPMVIAQAMALGKPIVATGVGGVSEMIQDGVSGYIVSPSDMTGFSNRIAELLIDRSKRKRFGTAAKLFATENYLSSNVASKTIQIYYDLLDKNAPSKISLLKNTTSFMS